MNRTDNALNWLIDQIHQGAEFPDACSQAARIFRVSHDKLRDAYDDRDLRRSNNTGYSHS